jgi:hypothetical protein
MHANIKISLLCLLSSVFLLTSLGEVFAEDLAPAPYREWGRELFRSYCASCHGTDGTGNGPAGASLKVAPADLTRISKKGKFPREKVIAYIVGETPVPAHGSREMPVWGRVLQEQHRGPFASAAARAEIYALTDYLESIQAKTAHELGTGNHL